MQIFGLQKLTLLDYPSRVACTVFTGGCNMRCVFCHNASLVTHIDASSAMDEDGFFAFLDKRRGVLDGVCVSGGEPTLHGDLPDFIRRIKGMGYAVKLDTNGSNPDMLRCLIERGDIDYVAMDIKNCRERYAETVGIAEYDIAPIEQSVAILMGGVIPFEFRTTICRGLHEAEDIIRMGEWLRGDEAYFLQYFTDSGDLIGEGLEAVSEDEMHAYCDILRAYIPKTALRGV